jgi:acetyl esterase/lipase
MLMRSILSLAMLAVTSVALTAAEPVIVPLWPKEAPGETGKIGPEKPQDPNPKDAKPIIRLTNVSKPELHIYKPAKDKDTGTAIVIAPGGGYTILAWDLEGTEVAEWLNSVGVTAAVLKYRVPRRTGAPTEGASPQAVMDGQRAISLVRSRAKEWGIEPSKIGMLGFSAGGSLTATVSTGFMKRTYEAVDEIDEVSSRPDFTVLIYPAYLVTKDKSKLIDDLPISKLTPPAFIAHAHDDPVVPESSVLYYLALKKAGVPADLHVYDRGGHGYGLRDSKNPVTTWPARCADWMKVRGLIK